MKWFKYDTDAFMSEGIDALMDAEGFAGYGRWVRVLEIVALKMDETDRCHAEYSIKKWCRLLGLKQKKLISFLELTENQLKTKVVYSENIIRIEIPNLLKKRDNYTKNLQVTKKPLASKEVEVEIEKKKIIKRRKPCASIDIFWKAYPKKKSKGEAEKAWATLRPDEALLKVMLLSIEKAKKTEGWEKEGGKYIPNPATWLRAKGWEDEIGEINSNRSNKVRACKGLYYSVTDDLKEEFLECPQRFDCPTYIGNLKDKDIKDLIYIRHDHPKIYNPSTEECGFNKAITQV